MGKKREERRNKYRGLRRGRAGVFGVAALGIATVVAPEPTAAQEFYGGGNLGLSYNSVTDNNSPEGSGKGLVLGGFAGLGFGDGYFVEGELRTEHHNLQPLSNDALESGELVALRFGRDFGRLTLDGFGGFVVGRGDEGTSERYFVGVSGSYALSDRFSVNGLVGYLDGDNGTDDDGEDAMRDFTHVGLGAGFQLNDRVRIGAQAIWGDGIMDDDTPADEAAEVKEVTLRVEYDLQRAGLSAYAGASYTDYYQGGTEDDRSYEKRIEAGLNWVFGADGNTARGRNRVALPRYADWLAIAGGVLE